jgi:hypothetical protein
LENGAFQFTLWEKLCQLVALKAIRAVRAGDEGLGEV